MLQSAGPPAKLCFSGQFRKGCFSIRSSFIDTGLRKGCLGWISASSSLLICTFLYSLQNIQLNTAVLVESENLKMFASRQTQSFQGKFWKLIASHIQPLDSLSWAKIILKIERFHGGMLILLLMLWRIITAPLSQESKHSVKLSVIKALIWLTNWPAKLPYTLGYSFK